MVSADESNRMQHEGRRGRGGQMPYQMDAHAQMAAAHSVGASRAEDPGILLSS